MRLLTAVLLIMLFSACSSNNSNDNAGETVTAFTVTGPIDGEIELHGPTSSVMNAYNYALEEFFIEGTAHAYTNTSALGDDGIWNTATGESAPYKTRVVVARPGDESVFNGSVVIEWLNVSSGFDISPDYVMMHTELLRQGYVWIGVSAQRVGVTHLQGTERYQSLVHPGDSFSYDIYTHAVEAALSKDIDSLLAGLAPDYIIAAGHSQAASRLFTHANAIDPIGRNIDGYFIHSFFEGAPLSQDPQPVISVPTSSLIRDDINVPTLVLQAEGDIALNLDNLFRPPDTAWFRLWEIAGAAHADLYSVRGGSDDGTEPSFAGVQLETALEPIVPYECAIPINSGAPHHYVVKAALSGLNSWIRSGEAMPLAPRLELNDDGTDLARDSLGNARGGIRTPFVDAPLAVLSGTGQGKDIVCKFFGSTHLLDSDELISLYGSEEHYISAAIDATSSALERGVILSTDAALITDWIQMSGFNLSSDNGVEN